ncbi:penicillin-binding protein 1A [Pustulibacterium marinum]|uniref:Penicillin-binding protein 1A n=1 Tax=Pustulibacterium marinum TaxID=1224947 RepID=A0A1I7EUA0_9FLAO|nr:transglycosylase domain-containing protein [Pustulibacterium marinum]SFU27490.1 penicillin-binding protein 1A [Pustulibacterium marinum]
MAKKAATNKTNTKKTSFKKYIIGFWVLYFLGALSVLFIFLFASWGVFGPMPDFRQLENPETNLASEIISSDGETLGKFYLSDNRTPVKFKDLPLSIEQALVATEDIRFYEHSGIDARGTLRAVTYLGKRGGASTITQQLAKLLFTETASTNRIKRVLQKAKEWVIAIRLERQYTKQEIMAMYLNMYDFNYNADGIRTAARTYFGVEPRDLKIEQSAMLVGMLKNSSYYNPFRREKLTLDRRNTVLFQMFNYDYISKQEKDSLQKLPLETDYHSESHNAGIATYFREYIRSYMKDWINENPKEDGEKYNLYLDGLKIYATIDSRMQEFAEKAVNDHMKDLQKEYFVQNTPKRNSTTPFVNLSKAEVNGLLKRAMKQSERWRHMKYDLGKPDDEIEASFKEKVPMQVFSWEGEIDTVMTPMDSIRYYKSFLRSGMMSMEPQTGHVKAWVGGINYKHFKFDMVKQGKRQVGSTFKPFVYATAVDQLHLAPCYEVPDVTHCIDANKYNNPKPWCPRNSGGETTGEMMALKDALANSVNTVTATLIDRIGPAPVIDLVHKLGIDSEIPEVPSIALGTPDVSVYEMVGAYGTFANQGVYVKPVLVTRIEDKNGTVLFEYKPESRDVLSSEVAYTMVEMMKGVTESGSGVRLRTTGADKWNKVYQEIITGYPWDFKNPIAGKTGTTQNNSDGWFMGIVPNLVTGVWVGGEDRSVHFRSIAYGQGASMALPIWANYMRDCYSLEELEISDQDFTPPEEMTIDLNCGKRIVEEGEQPIEKPDTDDGGFTSDF